MDEIYQAPVYKRLLSSLLDLIIVLLLSVGFFMLLSNGALDIGFHNLKYKKEQFRIQDESSLFYVEKDVNGNYLEVSSLTFDETKENEHQKFLKAIHDYYMTYVESETKTEAIFNKEYVQIDENTLKSAIFFVNSINDSYETYALLDEVIDVSDGTKINKSNTEKYNLAIKNYFMDKYKGIYRLALTSFTSSERFQNVVNHIASIERIEILICVGVSSLIFMSLPILLNKNSETAFMHVFSVCFTDSYGYKVKWKHRIIRSIVVLLINIASAYLYAIPLVINGLVYIFTPSKRSLVDYAANETGIDKKYSVMIEE